MCWHPSIDFGDGLVSKAALGLEGTTAFGNALLDGFDLHSHTLLDIGAWNGAYSFEAKRRGAARVVASDLYVWTHPVFKGREIFELARRLNNLDVEGPEIAVE